MRGFTEDEIVEILRHKNATNDVWDIGLTQDGGYVTVLHSRIGHEVMRIQTLQRMLYGEFGEEMGKELQDLFCQLEWSNQMKNIIDGE